MRSPASGLGLSPELERLYRRADSPCGQYLEALQIVHADIRQRKAQWALADSVAGLQLRNDAGVQLAESVATLIAEHAPHNAYFTDLDLDGRFPYVCAAVEWAGVEPAHIEIKRVKAWLHPRFNPAQPQTVKRWRLDLLRVVSVGGLLGIPARRQLFCAPLSEPIYYPPLTDTATQLGSSEGLVTFDYAIAPLQEHPRPKRHGPPIFAQQLGSLFYGAPAPVTLFLITALNKDGGPATNVGFGYDNGVPSVATNGNILSSRKLLAPAKAVAVPSLLIRPGTHSDGGDGGGTPRLAIEYGTYVSGKLAFSAAGNRIDLTAVPTNKVVFTVNGNVPDGTALTGQVLKDGGNPVVDADWRTFLSGQSDGDLANVSKRATYEIRAKLDTDASASLTPILRKLAAEETKTTPAYDAAGNSVAQVQLRTGYGIDLETLKGEIVRGMIVGILDGERDYQSWVENLLGAANLKDYTFRLWLGAPTSILSKDKWLHIDDYLPEGQMPRKGDYAIAVVSSLVLLRGLLPKKSPGASYAPDGDISVGTYTTDTGAGVNLYLRTNEVDADDLTFVQSGLDPVNQIYKATLPTPLDLPKRKLYVDYRIQKDVAGGKTIDATIELRQSGALIATSGVQPNISDFITPGSFQLSDASMQLLTDPTSLELWITFLIGGAGGSRRGRLTWWRFRTEDRRDAVGYSNQSVKAVYEDLLMNQLALDTRYLGPSVEDTTTLVTKAISEITSEELPTSKDEVDAVLNVIGYGTLASQGRLKAVNMKDPGEIRAVWPLDEIIIHSITMGIEDRIDNPIIPFNWNAAKAEFDDEWEGASAAGILAYWETKLDGGPWRLPQEIAKWIAPQPIADYAVLARSVGVRMLDWFGGGRGRALIEHAYGQAELEPGDTVVFEQDQLVIRDPYTGEDRRGRIWLAGKIELCDDEDPCQNKRFTVAIRPLYDLFGSDRASTRAGFVTPDLYELTPNVDQQGKVTLVIKARGGGSVKYAVSTASEPTVATVRAALAQNLDADGILRTGIVATLTPGQSLYIAALAYDKGLGGGAESALASAKISHYEGNTSLEVVQRSITSYQASFRLTARDVDGDTVKIHYRTVLASSPSDDYASPAPTSEGAFSAQPHFIDPITLDRDTVDRYLEAWAQDVNGNRSPIARLAIPAITSTDQENALTGLNVSSAFHQVGCAAPPGNQRIDDTITWTNNTPWPNAVVLSRCEGTGCALPGVTLQNPAFSGFVATSGGGIQSGTGGIGSPYKRKFRISVLNQYGTEVDFDDTTEQSTAYADC